MTRARDRRSRDGDRATQERTFAAVFRQNSSPRTVNGALSVTSFRGVHTIHMKPFDSSDLKCQSRDLWNVLLNS